VLESAASNIERRFSDHAQHQLRVHCLEALMASSLRIKKLIAAVACLFSVRRLTSCCLARELTGTDASGQNRFSRSNQKHLLALLLAGGQFFCFDKPEGSGGCRARWGSQCKRCVRSPGVETARA